MLQITDTTAYFVYKVKLHQAAEVKEGYILKATFANKPYLLVADKLPVKQTVLLFLKNSS